MELKNGHFIFIIAREIPAVTTHCKGNIADHVCMLGGFKQKIMKMKCPFSNSIYSMLSHLSKLVYNCLSAAAKNKSKG